MIGFQPLRIHSGWRVAFPGLLNVDPSTISSDDEDMWLNFTQDLFYLHYGNIYGLDLGWYPEANPNGRFELQLVTHRDFKPLLSIETRNIEEIIDAVDKITWAVDQGILPSTDPNFSIDHVIPSIRLQLLIIHQAWTIEKNCFVELDPNKEISDQLKYKAGTLLHLKGDDDEQILLSWDSGKEHLGKFDLKMIDPNKKRPLRTHSTRSVEEVVDWIEKACIGEM